MISDFNPCDFHIQTREIHNPIDGDRKFSFMHGFALWLYEYIILTIDSGSIDLKLANMAEHFTQVKDIQDMNLSKATNILWERKAALKIASIFLWLFIYRMLRVSQGNCGTIGFQKA